MARVQAPSFAELLRRYRATCGLTQESLAARAGLAARTISDLERGVASRPQRETLRLLVEALELSDRDRSRLEAAAGERSLAGSSTVVPAERATAAAPPPLAGRASEVRDLDRPVGGQGPPLLILAGEPGIGKTRLLDEASKCGVAAGMVILRGGCQRRSAQEPFAPLTEAVARSIEAQPPTARRANLQGCHWLVHLLPELANAIGPTVGSVPAEHERRLMFQSVSRYLRNVASPAGVLLVLDDLQWAGTDAFDLLAVLVRSADDIPLRVLCAYRSTEVEPGDPLAGFLADLVRPDLAKHLSLAPLSAVESTQLLAGLLAGVDGVDEAVEERIVQRAGGVPFFVVSCAEAMRSGSLADEVPWDLAQAVRQRVAALPPAAQGVLCAAAVGGRVVPRSLLAAVCDGPEDAILAGLDAACSAGLLTYTPSHLFQFAHDVIREALETSTAPGQRILLHRRVAEWLESLPQGTRRTAEIAWHFQQSGDLERALPYALLAGDQAAAAFAHGDAEKHYRTVIELAGDPTVSAQRGQVVKTEALEKLGATLATMARLEEALESLERAARMNRARGDFEREGQVVARIGHAHFLRGSEQEGIARLRPVLDSLAQCGPSSGLARLYVAHARLIHGLCRPEEQLAAATKGVAVARAIGDDETLAMASRLRGQALLDLRRLHEALETYSEVLPLLEEARNLAGLCSALVDTAYVHDALGEFDEARPHLHRALHIAREMEDPLSISSVLEALAWNLLLVGRWAEARSRTEEMESILGPLEVSRRSGHPLFLRVELALRGGRREDARQYLKEGLVQHGKVYLIAKSVQFALARLDLLEGRPEAALPVLRAQVEEREPNPDLTLLPYLAEAYLGVGDVARADIRLMRATEWSRAAQARRTLIEALRVRGLFLIHEARRPEARDSLEEALSLTRSIGVPWEEGRLLVLLGELHARAGDAGPARERWEQAHAIFERLGAGKLAEETQRTLARFR